MVVFKVIKFLIILFLFHGCSSRIETPLEEVKLFHKTETVTLGEVVQEIEYFYDNNDRIIHTSKNKNHEYEEAIVVTPQGSTSELLNPSIQNDSILDFNPSEKFNVTYTNDRVSSITQKVKIYYNHDFWLTTIYDVEINANSVLLNSKENQLSINFFATKGYIDSIQKIDYSQNPINNNTIIFKRDAKENLIYSSDKYAYEEYSNFDDFGKMAPRGGLINSYDFIEMLNILELKLSKNNPKYY